jgi:hypothetical protein
MRGWAVALSIGLLACSSADDSTLADAGADSTADVASQNDAAAADASVADQSAADACKTCDASTGPGTPPFGGSSGGSGGAAPVNGTAQQAGNVSYFLIVPSSVAKPSPFLLVYSGTEGGATMTSNLSQVGSVTQTSGFIRAVLDGVVYNGNANAGAAVLDAVRSKYDVDNDRTYLLSESAGTSAGLALGFTLRQSYFAAYWVNDINASASPSQSASQLGIAPWGQVGPGGDFTDANAVVAAMQAAGYRLPNPAPYNGTGAGTHGDPNQFVAAVSFFPGKTRK